MGKSKPSQWKRTEERMLSCVVSFVFSGTHFVANRIAVVLDLCCSCVESRWRALWCFKSFMVPIVSRMERSIIAQGQSSPSPIPTPIDRCHRSPLPSCVCCRNAFCLVNTHPLEATRFVCGLFGPNSIMEEEEEDCFRWNWNHDETGKFMCLASGTKEFCSPPCPKTRCPFTMDRTKGTQRWTTWGSCVGP